MLAVNTFHINKDIISKSNMSFLCVFCTIPLFNRSDMLQSPAKGGKKKSKLVNLDVNNSEYNIFFFKKLAFQLFCEAGKCTQHDC